MSDADGGISNGQRAFWMVLFYMLVGPFFGALAAAMMFTLSLLVGAPPEPFASQSLAEAADKIGPVAVASFVWSAIPAALAALGMVMMVIKRGTIGPFVAGAVGVIAFTAAIVVFPFPTGGWQPLIAFVAGLVSLACRQVLVAGGILKRAPDEA